MIRRPPRSTQSRSSAASDVYKRQRLRTVKVRSRELKRRRLKKRRSRFRRQRLRRRRVLVVLNPRRRLQQRRSAVTRNTSPEMLRNELSGLPRRKWWKPTQFVSQHLWRCIPGDGAPPLLKAPPWVQDDQNPAPP